MHSTLSSHGTLHLLINAKFFFYSPNPMATCLFFIYLFTIIIIRSVDDNDADRAAFFKDKFCLFCLFICRISLLIISLLFIFGIQYRFTFSVQNAGWVPIQKKWYWCGPFEMFVDFSWVDSPEASSLVGQDSSKFTVDIFRIFQPKLVSLTNFC